MHPVFDVARSPMSFFACRLEPRDSAVGSCHQHRPLERAHQERRGRGGGALEAELLGPPAFLQHAAQPGFVGLEELDHPFSHRSRQRLEVRGQGAAQAHTLLAQDVQVELRVLREPRSRVLVVAPDATERFENLWW
jgi:hypothetical protein